MAIPTSRPTSILILHNPGSRRGVEARRFLEEKLSQKHPHLNLQWCQVLDAPGTPECPDRVIVMGTEMAMAMVELRPGTAPSVIPMTTPKATAAIFIRVAAWKAASIMMSTGNCSQGRGRSRPSSMPPQISNGTARELRSRIRQDRTP